MRRLLLLIVPFCIGAFGADVPLTADEIAFVRTQRAADAVDLFISAFTERPYNEACSKAVLLKFAKEEKFGGEIRGGTFNALYWNLEKQRHFALSDTERTELLRNEVSAKVRENPGYIAKLIRIVADYKADNIALNERNRAELKARREAQAVKDAEEAPAKQAAALLVSKKAWADAAAECIRAEQNLKPLVVKRDLAERKLDAAGVAQKKDYSPQSGIAFAAADEEYHRAFRCVSDAENDLAMKKDIENKMRQIFLNAGGIDDGTSAPGIEDPGPAPYGLPAPGGRDFALAFVKIVVAPFDYFRRRRFAEIDVHQILRICSA